MHKLLDWREQWQQTGAKIAQMGEYRFQAVSVQALVERIDIAHRKILPCSCFSACFVPMKHFCISFLFCTLMSLQAQARQSADFPRSQKFLIQMTSTQVASQFAEYLVPPLLSAFRSTGMKFAGTGKADFAATVQTDFDVGQWVDTGDDVVWLYTRSITVGLSPADADIEPRGVLSPHFSVTAKLMTSSPDRVDELNCLIKLATRELAARYEPKGHVTVNGQSCARK